MSELIILALRYVASFYRNQLQTGRQKEREFLRINSLIVDSIDLLQILACAF